MLSFAFRQACVAVLFFAAPVILHAEIDQLIPNSVLAGSQTINIVVRDLEGEAEPGDQFTFDGVPVTSFNLNSRDSVLTIPANLLTTPRVVQVAIVGFNSLPFTILPGTTQGLIERAAAPQIADGGGWKTRLVLLNQSASKVASYRINFFGQNGQPLAFPLMNGSGSTFQGSIPPAGSVFLETQGMAPVVQAGWAEILSGGPGTSPVRAVVAFRHRLPDVPDQETSVTSLAGDSRAAVFALDNASGYVTSIAVANTAPQAADVVVRFRDPNGNVFHQETVNLAAQGHAFFETTNRFAASQNRQGSVEFATTTGALAVLCLWFNPTGPFTSIPEVNLLQ